MRVKRKEKREKKVQNERTRELQRQIENCLMRSGCDANFDSVIRVVETEGMKLREVAQAYAKAVCYAASAHIENCYDTPNSEVDGKRGASLTVAHYVKWMTKELSNPHLHQSGLTNELTMQE